MVLGFDDFDADKSVTWANGRSGPGKSRFFRVLKWQRVKIDLPASKSSHPAPYEQHVHQ